LNIFIKMPFKPIELVSYTVANLFHGKLFMHFKKSIT
jgi:hypothetical protein